MFSCTGRECSNASEKRVQDRKETLVPYRNKDTVSEIASPSMSTASHEALLPQKFGKLDDLTFGENLRGAGEADRFLPPRVQPQQLPSVGLGMQRTAIQGSNPSLSVPPWANTQNDPKSTLDDDLAIRIRQYTQMTENFRPPPDDPQNGTAWQGNSMFGPQTGLLGSSMFGPDVGDGQRLERQVRENSLCIDTMKHWKELAQGQLQSAESNTARCYELLDNMTLKLAGLELKMMKHEEMFHSIGMKLRYLETEPPTPADEVANRQPHLAISANASGGHFKGEEKAPGGDDLLCTLSARSSGVRMLEDSVKRVEQEIEALKAQRALSIDMDDLVKKSPAHQDHRVSHIEKSVEEIKMQQRLIQELQEGLSHQGGKVDDLNASHNEKEDNVVARPTKVSKVPSLHELDFKVLDKAEMYAANDSIWDMALFIGLPYLGAGISAVIFCVLTFNIVLQLWFSQIISTYMLDGPVDPDFLSDLLRFRVAVAHNADYADKLNMRSMVSQICTADQKLHLSGRQFDLNDDMTQFEEGAMPLCVLTIVCWLMKVLGEASEALQFLRMIWSIRRAPTTKVITDAETLAQSERISRHQAQGLIDDMSAEQAASLLKIDVIVRLMSLTLPRAVYASLVIALPRIILAVILGIIGVQYLSITSKMEDLLLNGMALAFIADIDELIYLLIVPRRAKTFMGNLEPLPVTFQPFKKYHHLPWLNGVLKLGIVAALTVVIVFALTMPFFDKLRQAVDVLCSGDTDFVVARSRATGMVHATKTQQSSSWTANDFAVLQLARPTFLNLSDWTPSDTIFGWLANNITYAIIEPPADSLAESRMNENSFDFVAGLSSLSLEDSKYLVCEDMIAGQSTAATLQRLRDVLGNQSIRGCFQDYPTILPYCSLMNMTYLRAICPLTCGCSKVLPQYIGFFAHPSFGCPRSCSSTRLATEGYEYDNGLKRPCDDTRPPVFFLAQPFLASGEDHEVMLVWFRNYIRGMFEYLTHQPGFEELVAASARASASAGFFTGDATEIVRQTIVSGYMAEVILSGTWEIAPGVPHPRGYQGCDYLTSPEVTFLLGIDMCSDEFFWSLRSICPLSCGCGSLDGCPISCKRQEAVLPCADMQDGHFYEATLATLRWLGNSSTAYSCEEVYETIRPKCYRTDEQGFNDVLRKVCPLTCNCHVPSSDTVGFFGSEQFGCPASCAQSLKAVIQLWYWQGTTTTCTDTPDYWLTNPSGHPYFATWVVGFWEWFLRLPNKYWELQSNIGILASGKVGPPLIPYELVGNYTTYITTGFNGMNLWLSGDWEILPGVPHPRGLKGCAFLTSYEILLMLGVDFCSVGVFSSLRYACPESCGCAAGMDECPYACIVADEDSIQAQIPTQGGNSSTNQTSNSSYGNGSKGNSSS